MDRYSLVLLFGLYIGALVLLYHISTRSFTTMYRICYSLIDSDHFAKVVISIFYFPGTLVHEMSHFFAALLLMLRVGEVKIFPEFHDEGIKLGHVTYERKDPVRGILVGIAPLFGGNACIIGLLILGQHLSHPVAWGIVGVLSFVIVSTMFSSNQDLKDAVGLIPLALCLVGFVYWNPQQIIDRGIAVYASQIYGVVVPLLIVVSCSIVVHCLMVYWYERSKRHHHHAPHLHPSATHHVSQ